MNRSGRTKSALSGAALAMAVGLSGSLLAPAGMAATGMPSGHHFDAASLPEGCRPEWHGGAETGQPPSREDMMRRLAEEYGLTGQQQQDLTTLVADYAERLQEIAEQLRVSGEKLAQTEPDDPYYWPLAQEVSAQTSAHAGETVILLSELREKVYQVLTAEQRAAIRQRIEERKAKCRPPGDAAQPSG